MYKFTLLKGSLERELCVKLLTRLYNAADETQEILSFTPEFGLFAMLQDPDCILHSCLTQADRSD